MPVTTFLFTDIEGSTRLWETHPDAMRSALAAHDETTTKTVDAHGGTVVKHMGDGAIAAFGSAGEAIDAAIALQTALADQIHPDVGALRVRMGIHSGDVEARDGDYFGPTLNRTARLMAVGHGGQVLVSLVTERLAGDRDDLVDLGEHRLRDLSRPERIFQVGDGDHPPLRTLDRAPNNLPVFATSFVGRQREFAEVATLLRDHRLVTLTGVGGAGKTRLALQVAADAADRFTGGVWFVSLAPVTDPDAVDGAVAEALGVGQDAGRSLRSAIIDHLADRTALVVVDNCEHLIDAAADLVEDTLGAAPDVKVIATSRELLGVPGEIAYGLRSMALPRRGEAIDPGALADYDAVRLFAERAAATKPGFRVDEDNATAVLEICRRLDGMPLALELAAARIRTFPPGKLAELLDQRFRLLTGGARTALPRQQTLAATIEWSYRLLDEQERTLLRRLSAFQGGFTFDAVTDVCAIDPIGEFDVVELLPSLVDKSLVVADDTDDEPRYRLLETIRQFARDRFEDTDEADAIRLRHAHHFERFARQAGEHLVGPDEVAWWGRLDDELDNLRTAITWASEHDHPELALSIATGAWRHWWFTGRWSEGLALFDRLLAMAGDQLPPLLEAKGLLAIGTLGVTSGRPDAEANLERASHAFREAHERRDPDLVPADLTASLINLAAELSNIEREYDAAEALNREAFELARELGQSASMSVAAGNIASAHVRRGEMAEARAWFATALEVAEAVGSRQRLADLKNQEAQLEMGAGDDAAAARAMAESVAFHRALGQEVQADMQQGRAETIAVLADPERSGDALASAVRRAIVHPEVAASRGLLAELLADRAMADARDGHHERAAVAWGAYEGLVGDASAGIPGRIREMVAEMREQSLEALGEDRHEQLFQQGRAMAMPEIVEFLAE